MSFGFPRTYPGFETVEHPGARVLARPEAVPWVRFVLESGHTLHGASALDPAIFQLEGRNPVYVIPAKLPKDQRAQDGKRWAVRHYARGGRLASRILGDRYLGSVRVRPFREIRASEAARDRGIQTPRVVAGAVYPLGFSYRADLVTEFIPDASDLVSALFDSNRKGAGGAGERLDALRAAGHVIRKMGAAGLRHRDMNARNILLSWHGAAPVPHLLDLDRCDVEPKGGFLSPTPMFQRLRRSLMKWERRTGIRLTEKEWKTLEEAAVGT